MGTSIRYAVWERGASRRCNARRRCRQGCRFFERLEPRCLLALPDLTLPGVPAHDDWVVGEEPFVLTRADDWKCLDAEPVTDLHWWGSYELWGNDADLDIEMRGFEIGAFRLAIWEDADGNPGGVPGGVLWETMVWFDALVETDTGEKNAAGSTVYRYDYILEEPFLPVVSNYYWLEIVALSPDLRNPARWQWQQSSPAVDPDLIPGSVEGSTPYIPIPPGDWMPVGDVNLAFEITKELHRDWGDAPDLGFGTGPGNYQTLANDQGANHVIRGPWFGDPTDRPDAEPDGQPDPVAMGDDLDTIYGPPANDDEDGVFMAPMVIGGTTTIQYEVNGVAGASYYVDAWIDWNGNGVWESWEQILNSAGGTTPVGMYTPTIAVPTSAQGILPGQTFARFRIN